MKTHCVFCKAPFFFDSEGPFTNRLPGLIYSKEGLSEAQISGSCEDCYDHMFMDENLEHYNSECDSCLYDLHTCSRCNDVVGHAHDHERSAE